MTSKRATITNVMAAIEAQFAERFIADAETALGRLSQLSNAITDGQDTRTINHYAVQVALG
jgi:hypothetical protein